MSSRCLVIPLDGLGDRVQESLNNQTPLQAARTPHLDDLARRGGCGLFHAARPGVALSSEEAHFALFGYPETDFPGRGFLEALGAGLEPGPEDVAVLARLINVSEEEGRLVVGWGENPASEKEIASLAEVLASHSCEGVDFNYHRTLGLGGILLLKGDVSPAVTDSHPLIQGRPMCRIRPWSSLASDARAQLTARALGEYLIWAYCLLSDHPVNQARESEGSPPLNALATQRAGQFKPVQPFPRRFGLNGASISSGLVYWGLAAFLGLEAVNCADSPDPARDMAERIRLAEEILSDYQFIHVHAKAADEAAHTKNPSAKKEAIEALDAGLGLAIGPLLANPENLIIVTSDHSTPSSGPLIHSGEPTPLVVVGQGVRRDGVSRFDEVSCAAGVLGLVQGRDFMPLVLNHLDRARLRGLMDSPDAQLFWPGDYEPFIVD